MRFPSACIDIGVLAGAVKATPASLAKWCDSRRDGKHKMNPASQLGKMAAGVPKKYSAEEIAKRTARLRKAQKARAKQQRAARHANVPS